MALARNQIVASKAAFFVSVCGIYLAEHLAARGISTRQLNLWFCIAVSTWAARNIAYKKFFELDSGGIRGSAALRPNPLVGISLACAFWIWSVHLMIGHSLTMTTFAFILCFAMMSIATIGIWPVTPIGAGTYILSLWGSLSLRLLRIGTVPILFVLGMDLSVGAVLWLCLYVTINQIEPLLRRSDRVDMLVQDIHDSNAKLENMGAQACLNLERRSMFFAHASHDFRQRLHGIKLVAYSAAHSLQADSAAREAMDRLSDEIESLNHYVTEVLDFARIEEFEMKANIRMIDLQVIFQRLDIQFEPLVETLGIHLHFWPTRIKLLTDPRILVRVLENLVSNAIKFTRGKVLICARRTGDGFAIEVRDQGPGIALDDIENIFEAFYQVNRTTKRAGAGVGLGLAIVHRLTRALGYSIDVNSRVGSGSMFRVLIPASTQIGGSPPPPPSRRH